MASLSDVLSTVQNGVVAFNNLTIQMKGSFNNISSQFAALNVTTSNVTLQTVYAELTTFTSGVTNMAAGVDTIPQNTDGTQLLTVSITPKLSTSKLLIRVMMPATNSAIVNMWAGLFQDSIAAALAATAIGVAVVDTIVPTAFTYQMTSGTTSSTTFKVRIGNIAGASTWAVNGISSARRLGGSQRVSITVEEIKA